jgi:hypothetical protein
MDRGSPQFTLNSPTSGAFHTLHQKKPRNTTPERNQDYSQYKFSDNEVSVVLYFRASSNTFAPSSPIPLSADTPERFKHEFSKTIPMGDTANRQQSQQSHSLQAGMDRGSPQFTLNSPTSGALHTLQQKETRNIHPQRNQDYSRVISSDNEVSVVLSFRASPNAFAPSAPI